MWKTKRKAICFIAISILLAVFCTGIYIWTNDRHEFGYLVQTVVLDDEHDILVDEKDGYYYLLYTENGRIKHEIKYKIIDDNYFNLPDYIYADGDDIYLQNYYNEVGYMETNVEFYRLDLDREKMVRLEQYTGEDVYNLFPGKDEEYVANNFYVKDGKLVHLIETYSGVDNLYRVYTAEFKNGKLTPGDEIIRSSSAISEFYRCEDEIGRAHV